MKRVIYEPSPGEEIPDARVTVTYVLPVAGVTVYDGIMPDDFTTEGTIHYDSAVISDAVYSQGEEIVLVTPKVIAKELDEPFVHQFSGWEGG